jgi:hypothetical protein
MVTLQGDIPMSYKNTPTQRAEDNELKPRLQLSRIVPQALLFAALLFGLSASAAKATTYYVSLNGNNTDGLSLQTAFNELNQVKWSSLSSADGGINLVIDGGTNGMVYHTTLTVPAGANVQSIVGGISGNAGNAYIDGTGSGSISGINILGYVELIGGAAGQAPTTSNTYIIVKNWSGPGIQISGNVHELAWIEVEGNAAGLTVSPSGYCNTVSNAIFHDNSDNIVLQGLLGSLIASWIYQDNDASPRACTGLTTNTGSQSNLIATNCVFGPGLVYGAQVGQTGSLGLYNCLLLNATGSNVIVSGQQSTLYMSNCTSFMTKDNPNGGPHCCVLAGKASNNRQLQIGSSIFEGGAVIVPPLTLFGNNNTEYAVTGNTTFLASTQNNPEFVSNVAAYPDNVSFKTLAQSNFSLQNGSPATGQGSSITSVSEFLQSYFH